MIIIRFLSGRAPRLGAIHSSLTGKTEGKNGYYQTTIGAILALFGLAKGHFIGTTLFKSAAQTALIGGIAAAARFSIARLIF